MEYENLKECAKYSSLRTSRITLDTYVSTENMLPNKGGITTIDSIPDCKTVSKYEPTDILISNIRPYFCKIWYATREGGCSNDVLVIKANKNIDSKFLYYVLSDNNFFNYDTVTSKGTKMPRGNKNAIMKYLVPKIELQTQKKIASILSAYDSLIENNTKRIKLLEQMAENLYKEWFVRFRFPGYENVKMENGMPKGWKVERYGNISTITAGGDCPKIYSNVKTDVTNIPIFSNGTTDGGLYGYTDKARITEPCITVSARGTIGYVSLHIEPFVPIVRLLAVVPNELLGVYYFYHSTKNNYLEGNGTSQQQLTKPMFSKRKIVVPTKDVCDKFETFVSNIYNNIFSLQHQNSLLARQRDLLLPRLMSGKLEVKP